MPADGVIEREVRISIGHRRIVSAFFDREDLKNWWGTRNAVTESRTGGLYLIVDCPPNETVEPVRGEGSPGEDPQEPLRGEILAGVIRTYHLTEGFTVAPLYWLPPRGESLGPMELIVQVQGNINQSIVRIRQSGFQRGESWDRYFQLASERWTTRLAFLRNYLDADGR